MEAQQRENNDIDETRERSRVEASGFKEPPKKRMRVEPEEEEKSMPPAVVIKSHGLKRKPVESDTATASEWDDKES
jgi:hypothetical protein